MTATRYPVGVVAHAMRAIAAHLYDHDLPVPLSILFATEADAVKIHVDSANVDVWVESLCVDRVVEDGSRRATHVHRHGRLPDSGVRVDLVSVHFDALVSVSA